MFVTFIRKSKLHVHHKSWLYPKGIDFCQCMKSINNQYMYFRSKFFKAIFKRKKNTGYNCNHQHFISMSVKTNIDWLA